jgi:hypothetical protein
MSPAGFEPTISMKMAADLALERAVSVNGGAKV